MPLPTLRFGNHTVYNFADQMNVVGQPSGELQTNIFRSVEEYVHYQSMRARAHIKVGPWFSASVDTSKAQKIMRDALHIYAETTIEIGVYDITLDPAPLLSPADKFARYIATLPEQYDQDRYAEFIQDWGTHYMNSASFGGRASMSTIISQDYFSRQSDSSISTQLSVQWGLFGGGGGGGTTANTTTSDFRKSSSSSTHSIGGDPAVRSFKSKADWAQWAKSVETTSPAVTKYTLTLLHNLVPDAARRSNVLQAINEYAAAHNTTFPKANLTTVTMGWCDCYTEGLQAEGPCPIGAGQTCAKLGCSKPGFVQTELWLEKQEPDRHDRFFVVQKANVGDKSLMCCRPCFTAAN